MAGQTVGSGFRPRIPIPPAARLCALVLVLVLAVAHTASASWARTDVARADGIRVLDDDGQRVDLARPPQRIVSLLPSSTEAVCALDACDRLVGVDRFSDWPPQIRDLPRVGDLEDARLERIVALRPDLVLAGAFARASDRLRSLGIPVLVVEAHGLDDIGRVLATVAAALGTPDAGDRLWRTLNEHIDRTAARMGARWHGTRVYLEVAPGPFAASESSYIGQLIARLGMDNIVPAALGKFPKINPEFVVRARPDLIIAAQRDFGTMAARPGWQRLAALRRQQVCQIDENFFDALLRPGPRIGDAVDAIAACLDALDARSGDPPPASGRDDRAEAR